MARRILRSGRIGPVRYAPLWEWRDLWWGLYWLRGDGSLTLYICLAPLLPLRLRFDRLPRNIMTERMGR